MSELRLYTFVNYYLSQIQQGIQTAHIVSEIMTEANESRRTISTAPLEQFVRYSEQDLMVLNWAEQYKTIIVCNGGNRESLDEMIELFMSYNNPFPWTNFYEDDQSLSSALTSVGIVLPAEIYDAYYDADNDAYFYDGVNESGRNSAFYNEGSFEYDLLKLVKSKRLA